MEIASMPAVVGFESSDVPITYTEQYRAKKKLHNRNLLTSGSIDDQSWFVKQNYCLRCKMLQRPLFMYHCNVNTF